MEGRYSRFRSIYGSPSMSVHLAVWAPERREGWWEERFLMRVSVGYHPHSTMAAGLALFEDGVAAATVMAARATYAELWREIRDCPDLGKGNRNLMVDMGMPTIPDDEWAAGFAACLAELIFPTYE